MGNRVKNLICLATVIFTLSALFVACKKEKDAPVISDVSVTGVTLNRTTLTLAVDGTATLVATVQPESATNKAVSWSSDNADVATVDNGTVTAKAEGTATITVTTLDGNKSATCAVTVNDGTVAVTGVTLDRTTLMLSVDGTATLVATVQPEDATNQAVSWTSDNADVATVDANGTVIAKAEGTATITVTTLDGAKSATCALTVNTLHPGEPEMVFVEGGTFTMGCTAEQGDDCEDGEYPAHQVTLSSFNIGKYPVTQAQWKAVMESNPSFFTGDNRPVETVSWSDAQTFIAKLNEVTGKNYRLPTEAEWEYAARGGNKSQGYKYSGSDGIDEVAWYAGNNGTHPVGRKIPNELEIYDMSGNVLEWCNDWYGEYSNAPQTNPQGPATGSRCVLRGGSWDAAAGYCRVSNRYTYPPGYSDNDRGLRLVLP